MATLEHHHVSKFTVAPGICPTDQRRMRRLDGYRDRCPIYGQTTVNERRARLSVERVFGPTFEVHTPRPRTR